MDELHFTVKAFGDAVIPRIAEHSRHFFLAEVTAGGTVPKFGKVGSALQTLVPCIFSVNAALWANPMVLIGAAMAGAALLIYKYWEPLSEFFGGVWDGIGKAFADAESSMSPLMDTLGSI